MFTELYGEEKNIDECPIDDVIMAPDYLIRITGIDEKRLDTLLSRENNAAYYCCEVLRKLFMQASSNCTSSEQSEAKDQILEVIDHALPLAGYKIMDGDHDSVIIRHNASDTDYEIKVAALLP